MLFTIELESITPRFRLQKDGSWREYKRDKSLHETDFTCTTPSEVTRQSSRGGTLKIAGTIYYIDSDHCFSDHDQLHHSSMVFRKEYPHEPTSAQLRKTITAGDDSVNNCLILNVDGKFELRQNPPFNHLINDPSIIIRHETFIQGNGYVGTDAAKHESLMTKLFETSMEYWANHLKHHMTQEYSDILHTNDTLKQICATLKELRNNWSPEY